MDASLKFFSLKPFSHSPIYDGGIHQLKPELNQFNQNYKPINITMPRFSLKVKAIFREKAEK